MDCTKEICGDNFERCGSISTYTNRKCRCGVCKAAWKKYNADKRKSDPNVRAYHRERARQQREAMKPFTEKRVGPCCKETCGDAFPQCGTSWAYKRCRCDVCREGHAQRCAEYNESHKAERAAADKVYRQKNGEKRAENNRKFHERNPGYRAEQSRRWRAQNPERQRLHALTYCGNRRAAVRKTRGMFTVEAMQRRLDYLGSQCYLRLDGCTEIATTIDHVKPLSKGGWHIPANIRVACETCNKKKANKWPYPAATSRVGC